MCGIIGVIGKREVAPLLVDGLRRLEYRGYDSAGVATLVEGRIERRRAEGKLDKLVERLAAQPIGGKIGIGHTRWATHGAPNETNAHPIATDRVAVVHNGIIENFQELKDELTVWGHEFETQTDTARVAALAIRFGGHPDLRIRARRGSPPAIGFGDGEMYPGSDSLALAPLTRRILYLNEGDWAVVTAEGAEVFDAAHKKVVRQIKETALTGALIGKGNHRHYMEKEIFEQPGVIGDTLHAHFHPTTRSVHLAALPFALKDASKLTIIACGTSFHSALLAQYWFERIARLPTEVEIASEFRYRAPDMAKGGVSLFISQSGETLDTHEAMRYAQKHGQKLVALGNQPENTIAREADPRMAALAGPGS